MAVDKLQVRQIIAALAIPSSRSGSNRAVGNTERKS